MRELIDIFGPEVLCESEEEMKTVLTLLYDEVKQRKGNTFDTANSEVYASMFLKSFNGFPCLQIASHGIYQGSSPEEFIKFSEFMIRYNRKFGKGPLYNIYD